MPIATCYTLPFFRATALSVQSPAGTRLPPAQTAIEKLICSR